MLKEDQKTESTTIEQINRKFSINFENHNKFVHYSFFKNFAPKKIVNVNCSIMQIVLVNKSESL